MKNEINIPEKETSEIMRFLYSPMGKLIFIGVISIMLLIPFDQVKSLIRERKERAESIKEEINREWGASFRYRGLVLRVPIKGKSKKKTYKYFFPETEKTALQVQASTKKRSIYEFPVFQCGVKSELTFIPDLDDSDLDFSHVRLGLLADPQTDITDFSPVKINGRNLSINDQLTLGNDLQFYATAPFAISTTTTQANIRYSVNGSGSIILNGNARNNKFSIQSNWDTPSFTGNVLPLPEKMKPDSGFTARWEMINLTYQARKGIQSITHHPVKSYASIDLLERVDHYQLNTRTAKYAILVILLTFTVFYLIELIGKMTIHPLHYLIVGLALILFYALLLSFSEQFGFAWSYLVASIGIIGLLSWYVYSVLQSVKFALTVFAAITLLYAFLFVLVNLETYALMVGSIGLFLVLFGIMSFTRRIKA